MRSTTRGSLSFCAWRRTSSSLEMVALFQFANVGRILPIIAHFSEYVELFMRTYIGVPMGRPLDKKEAVLYGQFVHAAYNMFKRDPTQLRPQPATGDIPDPYELVAWLNMSDYFFWWSEKPKFYGFIAWRREQKHNFVLDIRGTEGVVGGLDDFMDSLVCLFGVTYCGRAEEGFEGVVNM